MRYGFRISVWLQDRFLVRLFPVEIFDGTLCNDAGHAIIEHSLIPANGWEWMEIFV